jgi:hypothetical protein
MANIYHTLGEVQKCCSRHAEAEASTAQQRVQPAKNLSSAGSNWDFADWILKSKAVASRVKGW